MQYIVYLTLAPIAAVIVLCTLVFAWHRRTVPGAKALIWYLVLVAGFLLGNTLELLNPTEAGTLFWARFDYLFIAFLPVTWLAFAMEYSGRRTWLAPQRFWIFCIEPVLTVIFAQTTEITGLFWKSISYEHVPGGFLTMSVTYGQWFFVHLLYVYGMLFAGSFFIGREFFFTKQVYRRQLLWTFAGMLFPLAFNAIYIYRLLPWLRKDFSPLAFALAGLVLALGIFRYRLLSLKPVARNLLVDLIPDGVLILDDSLHVVDYNPAAKVILRLPDLAPIGLSIETVWPESRQWLNFPVEGRSAAADLPTRPDVIRVERDGQRRAYSLLMTPLWTEPQQRGKKPHTGWLLLFSDVTRRVDAEQALAITNAALGDSNAALSVSNAALSVSNAALSAANARLRELNEDLEARVAARTEALSARASELESLTRVSAELRKAGDLQNLLAVLLKETAAIFSAGAGAIFLVEREELVLRARLGDAAPDLPETLVLARTPGDELWEVVETGEMKIVRGAVDQRGAETGADRKDGCQNDPLQTLAGRSTDVLIAPFRAARSTIGLLVLGLSPDADQPLLLEEYRRPLVAIAEMAGNALQRVRTMENLEGLVQMRTRNLSILYEVTTVANQFLALPELLRRVLEIVLDLMGLRAALVHLVNEEGRLLLAAHTGLTAEQLRGLPGPDEPETAWQQALRRESIAVLPGQANESGARESAAKEAGARIAEATKQAKNTSASVGLPVRAKGRLLGVMTVMGETIGHFSADDIALLAAIADNTGVAIERAELRQKASEAAVMEERQRLSRDLHDSVTQSLYSLVLFAEAGADSLQAGDASKAAHHLARLGETAQQALREMRLLIYELRPMAFHGEGLVGALRYRLETVERRAGMEVQLEIDQCVPLPDEVELGLFGIAQEAFNNVLKHARADRIIVRLSVTQPDAVRLPDENLLAEYAHLPIFHGRVRVELEITDNGKGFTQTEEDRPAAGGIGFSSMRERAGALGGTLSIRSVAGQGTSILVTLQIEEAGIES